MRRRARAFQLGSIVVMACVLMACDHPAAPGESSVSAPMEVASSVQLDGASAKPVSAKSVSVNLERRARIERLFSGFEYTPTGEELREVEPDEEALRATLIEIYQDDAVRKDARQRALASLQHVPGEATRAFYEGRLGSQATSDAERRIVIKAYKYAVGADAEPVLIAQLNQDDAFSRLEAIKALGALKTPSAIAALEAHTQVESVKHVRKRLGAILGRDIGESNTTLPNQGVK